jgi:hypothetical protein
MLPPKVLDRCKVPLEGCPLWMTVEDEVLHPVHSALELIQCARGERGGQRGPLPAVLMVDLGHRRAQAPLELGLQRGQLLALPLEIAGGGEVEVDEQEGDERGRGGSRDGGS